MCSWFAASANIGVYVFQLVRSEHKIFSYKYFLLTEKEIYLFTKNYIFVMLFCKVFSLLFHRYC